MTGTEPVDAVRRSGATPDPCGGKDRPMREFLARHKFFSGLIALVFVWDLVLALRLIT